jgi:hypothetical protein
MKGAEILDSAVRGGLRGGGGEAVTWSKKLLQYCNTQTSGSCFESGLDHECLPIFVDVIL